MDPSVEHVKEFLREIIPPGSRVSVELVDKSKSGHTEHLKMSAETGPLWHQRRDITDEVGKVLGMRPNKDGGIRVHCAEDDSSDYLKRFDKGTYLIKELSEKLYGTKNCLDGRENEEVQAYKANASKTDLLDRLKTAWKPSDCKEVTNQSCAVEQPERQARKRLM